jgi:predicted transcriptional regulator of viral defense system
VKNSIIFHNGDKIINIKKYNMQYYLFESHVKQPPAFNLNDIRKFAPGFHRRQLQFWLDKGYIRPFAGGYYMLANQDINENILFVMANRLYEPSYISLESALAYHQVIPETVLGVTSVSSRRTRKIESDWGVFSYRSVQPQLMFGYQVVEVGPKIKYKIATLEKAVLDYLYLNHEISSAVDFEGLRWNREILRPIVEGERFRGTLAIIDKQALRSRVDGLMRYLDA